MDHINPCVKTYAWGSRTVLADLQGRPAPTEGPEAELWMGAHPSGPSSLVRGGTQRNLNDIISDNPVGELGADVVAHFGNRLPFLMKVLAADAALSIQVHPDRAQAEAGFAAEEAAGIPRDHPERNYKDDWPKPEVLVALEDFEVLAGFRSASDAARVLRLLEVPGLQPIIDELEVGGDECRTNALAHILGLPAQAAVELVERTVESARRLAQECEGDDTATFAATVRIAGEHPGDSGVIAALLMQHLTLRPGEGLYMDAAGPHAYLRGAGVEVMANSDNVLRAGLTGKHIDVPEVLRIIDPNVDVPVLRPLADSDGVRSYTTPASEFALFTVDLIGRRVEIPGKGPRIVLVTDGELHLTGADGDLHLVRGQSAYLSAESASVFAADGSHGKVFVATAGLASLTPRYDRADLATQFAPGGTGHRRASTRKVTTRLGTN